MITFHDKIFMITFFKSQKFMITFFVANQMIAKNLIYSWEDTANFAFEAKPGNLVSLIRIKKLSNSWNCLNYSSNASTIALQLKLLNTLIVLQNPTLLIVYTFCFFFQA